MAKKDISIKKAQAAVSATSGTNGTSSTPAAKTKRNKLAQSFTELSAAVETTYNDYVATLTPRLKLIDLFLSFLVALGILQFVYVLLVGNFPFNAFLGGFIACVGQFVLTVSLRLQIKSATPKKIVEDADEEVEDSEEVEDALEEELHKTTDTKTSTDGKVFKYVSPERSFGDFIFASLILHFVVYHFIN
ncbi:DAD family-domain-containing protein [Scheffersomyces xylosifermentans]|uniref:DAD family-domain-containing protein n=1 Tax=Scheffersomyces xylosifermentans TaxID=1304137 RepID=UPI00315DFBE1